jgi:hypothetical protein
MKLLLRTRRADDRIHADRLPSGEKWLWFLHILRATPNKGVADTLEDAKAALADSYRRHGGHMP